MAEFPFATSLDRLQTQIRAANIPLTGVTPRQPLPGQPAHFTDNGQGFFIELHFSDSATSPQRAQAATILAGFSFEKRKQRTRAALLADVQALSAQQRNLLLNAVAVDFLQREPEFARRIGIGIDGDEIDPNALLKG
jgi:hypothetical protein